MYKILIIEDQTEIRENLEEYLELCNYEVMSARDGQLGIELMDRVIPDLIICDIAMPVMDGYEVLRRVRARSSTQDIPFVFFSASAQEKDIEKGTKAGADGYFTKPIASEKMERVIQELLNSRKG